MLRKEAQIKIDNDIAAKQSENGMAVEVRDLKDEVNLLTKKNEGIYRITFYLKHSIYIRAQN